jgi:hypothetical protein
VRPRRPDFMRNSWSLQDRSSCAVNHGHSFASGALRAQVSRSHKHLQRRPADTTSSSCSVAERSRGHDRDAAERLVYPARHHARHAELRLAGSTKACPDTRPTGRRFLRHRVRSAQADRTGLRGLTLWPMDADAPTPASPSCAFPVPSPAEHTAQLRHHKLPTRGISDHLPLAKAQRGPG